MNEEENNWYYAEDENTIGPISLDVMRAKVARGELLPEDFVFRDGWEDWASAGEVPLLWAQVETDTDPKPLDFEKDATAAGEAALKRFVDGPKDAEAIQSLWKDMGPFGQGILLAIASVGCGLFCCVGWPSVPGVIFGQFALRKIPKSDQGQEWRKVAIVGLVLNYLGLFMVLLNFVSKWAPS